MTKPNENLPETSEKPTVSQNTDFKAEFLEQKAENQRLWATIGVLTDDIQAAETTLKCILEGVQRLENQFRVKYMARGEFYGVEFK